MKQPWEKFRMPLRIAFTVRSSSSPGQRNRSHPVSGVGERKLAARDLNHIPRGAKAILNLDVQKRCCTLCGLAMVTVEPELRNGIPHSQTDMRSSWVVRMPSFDSGNNHQPSVPVSAVVLELQRFPFLNLSLILLTVAVVLAAQDKWQINIFAACSWLPAYSLVVLRFQQALAAAAPGTRHFQTRSRTGRGLA